MKISLAIYLLLIYNIVAWGQGKKIDNNTYKSWTSLKGIESDVSSMISNDGKYIAYKYGAPVIGDSLVIQSVNSEYIRGFRNASKVAFTGDSRIAVFLLNGDSLGILLLGTADITYITNVQSFELPKNGSGRWLAYLKNNKEKEFVIKDFWTWGDKEYRNVEDYKFDDKGNTLLIKTGSHLLWKDLVKGSDKNICNCISAFQLKFDQLYQQLVFFTKGNDGTEIRYYKKGMDSSRIVINDKTEGLKNGLIINDGLLSFSPNGNKVFFEIKDRAENYSGVMKKGVGNMKIWNYKDQYIESKNLGDQIFMAVTDINNSKVIQLTDSETSFLEINKNKYILTCSNVNIDEYYWNNERLIIYLVSTSDGSRKEIKKNDKSLNFPFVLLSPCEKFVVWFDYNDKQYYSYEIATGITKNISRSLKVPLDDDESDILIRRLPFTIAGWLPNDDKILIYDRFDIWQLDPKGDKLPVNITMGYGRKENIILRKVGGGNFIVMDSFLIAGFNRYTKANGFFNFSIKNGFLPNQQALGNYVYYGNISSNASGSSVSWDIPQKAKNENIYVVRRMSADQSPNLFLTRDFVRYGKITNIHPEKEYNWLKTQLINWELPNGNKSMGILYKPANFDSTRKYPIIFHYYEKRSDELNVFKEPELSGGELDVPWYVSNGYLVFVPDIHYEIGNTAESVTNTIISALEKLKSYSWFDIERIGLQGHSFGGYETLILITRLNLFRAAQESAGPCDFISGYSHIVSNSTRQSFYEFNQPNLGASPWDRPEIYLKNSPLFHLKNINTPLLIMQNKLDLAVSFSQSVELYAALRRLKKQVWFLQYDKEDHLLLDPENILDFNIKQQQFFDHYLKDMPLPYWMK